MFHSSFFTFFGFGVRIWYRPSLWYWGRYSQGGKKIYDCGPVTVYKGW